MTLEGSRWFLPETGVAGTVKSTDPVVLALDNGDELELEQDQLTRNWVRMAENG